MSTELGVLITRLRKQQGYSGRSFAKKIGKSSTFMWKIEHGEAVPGVETLEKIVSVLGNRDELFCMAGKISREIDRSLREPKMLRLIRECLFVDKRIVPNNTKCLKCNYLQRLFKRTPGSYRDRWLTTKLFVELHGADICDATEEIQKNNRYQTMTKSGIYDTKTGLEWREGPDNNINMKNAKAWIADLPIADGTWRLPTHKELAEIWQNNDSMFEKLDGCWIWSSDKPKDYHGIPDYYSYVLAASQDQKGQGRWVDEICLQDMRVFAVRLKKII